MEIHDTVLIAAAFSMYNRYVDGLGTLQPSDPGYTRKWASTWPPRGYMVPAVREPVGTA